jgi:Zn-dependent membrane protease YugP
MYGFAGYGTYLLFALPALLLGFWAQIKIKSAYRKFSQIRIFSGVTGAMAARRVLDAFGLHDVRIEAIQGTLTDHYDPTSRVLRLSAAVYQTPSIAAVGVAAHEAGHAIQHAESYPWLTLRTVMVPTVNIGSFLGPIIFIVGLLLAGSIGTSIAWVGLGLFALTAVFALVTLPVELNASARAKAALQSTGIVISSEADGINSVLNAAALTYVAGAAQALSTLAYYAFMLLGRNRD